MNAEQWARLEEEAAQRLLGALVARHGWTLEQEAEVRVLAFVALAGVKAELVSDVSGQ